MGTTPPAFSPRLAIPPLLILVWEFENVDNLTCFGLQPLLEPATWKAVRSLLPERANGSLASLCTWPDDIKWMQKYHWTAPLHYIDTPDFLCRYNYDRKYWLRPIVFLLRLISNVGAYGFLCVCVLSLQVTVMMSMVTRAFVLLELSITSPLNWHSFTCNNNDNEADLFCLRPTNQNVSVSMLWRSLAKKFFPWEWWKHAGLEFNISYRRICSFVPYIAMMYIGLKSVSQFWIGR